MGLDERNGPPSITFPAPKVARIRTDTAARAHAHADRTRPLPECTYLNVKQISADFEYFVNEHEALIASLFRDSVSIACGDPTRAQHASFPEEEALVGDASPSRRLEILEGRACARAALRKLGYDEAPILRGKDRQPRWPNGFVGSISHTETFCAAAVARESDWAGLGLDVETDLPVSEDFARRVCSNRELVRCAEHGPPDELARVIFSAKESVYKLQHPLSGIVLYWRDLEVLLGDGHFNARFLTACPPFHIGQELIGRWCRSRGRGRATGLIFTGLELCRAGIKTL
jgi:4'-phosphopantetheinyl transferase EntD